MKSLRLCTKRPGRGSPTSFTSRSNVLLLGFLAVGSGAYWLEPQHSWLALVKAGTVGAA